MIMLDLQFKITEWQFIRMFKEDIHNTILKRKSTNKNLPQFSDTKEDIIH